MHKFLSILGAVLISTSLYSQASNAEAKSLLDASSSQMKSYQSISLDFSYTFENRKVEPPIIQSQAGTISLKGEDYHIKLNDMEQIRVGNKLYNILIEDEEVQISSYEEGDDEEGISPSKILSSFSSGYSYKLGENDIIDGKTIQYIILKPVSTLSVKKIIVGIEKATKHIYSLQQWGTNGTVTTLKVKSFKANPQLPASHFTFNRADYKDYYISE
jgi:outer membrane lipoprotein-sorting protein